MKHNDAIHYRVPAARRAQVFHRARVAHGQCRGLALASCDAGVAVIPKFGQHTFKRVSKPMAEKYGITQVRWSGAAQIQWAEGLRG